MVEKNLYRFSYLDNDIFQPSKMEFVSYWVYYLTVRINRIFEAENLRVNCTFELISSNTRTVYQSPDGRNGPIGWIRTLINIITNSICKRITRFVFLDTNVESLGCWNWRDWWFRGWFKDLIWIWFRAANRRNIFYILIFSSETLIHNLKIKY